VIGLAGEDWESVVAMTGVSVRVTELAAREAGGTIEVVTDETVIEAERFNDIERVDDEILTVVPMVAPRSDCG
jgi:hypothetical protein